MIIKSNNEGRVRGAVLYKAVAETLERLNVCVRAYYMLRMYIRVRVGDSYLFPSSI